MVWSTSPKADDDPSDQRDAGGSNPPDLRTPTWCFLLFLWPLKRPGDPDGSLDHGFGYPLLSGIEPHLAVYLGHLCTGIVCIFQGLQGNEYILSQLLTLLFKGQRELVRRRALL